MSTYTLQAIPKEFYSNNQLLEVADFQRASDYHTLSLALQTSQIFSSGVLLGLVLGISSGSNGKISLTQGIAFDGMGKQILLVNEALYNNTVLQYTSNGFVIDLSSNIFWNKNWSLVISYYETQNTSIPNIYTIAPKLELIDISSPAAAFTIEQVPLGNIAITNRGTTAAPDIDIQLTPGNRNTVTIYQQLIPTIPAAKINGQLTIGQIPSLPFSVFQGQITPNQLPPIPASMITGILSPSQLPPITTGGSAVVALSVSHAFITTLQQITVNITVPTDASFTLSFISEGEVATVDNQKQSAQFTKTANGYSTLINITQTTTINLTAVLKNGETQQAESHVQLLLTPASYMTQLKSSSKSTPDAITALVKQFSLQALSNNNIYTLAESMYKAQYQQSDIYQYITAYYENLGYDFLKGGYLSFLTIAVKNLINGTQ
jgi:hypothetical protein